MSRRQRIRRTRLAVLAAALTYAGVAYAGGFGFGPSQGGTNARAVFPSITDDGATVDVSAATELVVPDGSAPSSAGATDGVRSLRGSSSTTGMAFPGNDIEFLSSGIRMARFQGSTSSWDFNGNTLQGASFWVEAVASSPHTLDARPDVRRFFTNTGATVLIVHDLPDTTFAGYTYGFGVTDVDGIRVDAGTGETITIPGVGTTADGGYIQSTTIGDTVWLLAVSSTQYFAISAHGTWSLGP